MNTESLNVEIWNRLRFGKPLDGLPLEVKDGRFVLAGFVRPAPSIIRRYETSLASVVERDESNCVNGVGWRNLDFTGAELDGIRFTGCEIYNCLFDNCDFDDLRVWMTDFAGCSFRNANLRRAVLGPVHEGRRNSYTDVDFSRADLRETVYQSAVFDRCLFRRAKLVRINFGGSTFKDCVFEGKLGDVLFYRRGYECEMFPPNEMINVDFSRAELHDVGFRGLVMDRVKLPDDPQHLVIRDFARSLDKIVSNLVRQPDDLNKKLLFYLGVFQKWVAPNQVQGVINISDVTETFGDEGAKRLLAAVPR